MATIDHSAYAPSSPALGFGDKVFSTIHSVIRKVRVHLAYRNTLNALDTLSPRQLTDIGLDGSDLRELAYRMAERNAH